MEKLPLELSPHIAKARYAHFINETKIGDQLFLLGYEECRPDYLIERNDFPWWTLEFVAGGHGSYLESGVQRRLRHGAVFTYGPGVAQRFWNDADRPFRKYFMVSGGEAFPALWRGAGLEPGRLFQLRNAAPIIAVFDQLLDEGEHSDARTPEIVDALERVLLALMARHKGTARGAVSASRKVYELTMDLVQRDYRELNSLTELAERVGYSGEYLCRIFRQHHGDSPYQVLLQRKMSAAWLLLRDGQFQVGAVATELGYEDPLHFSRVFKKVMGCAPSLVKSAGV